MSVHARFDRTSAKTRMSRALRRSLTAAERTLWHCLRSHQLEGLGFRRQHPVGRFVLDFYCPALRLAIELDGDQHGRESHVTYDARRDDWLRGRGVHVLRFWNNEVLENVEGVLLAIQATATQLKQPTIPTPTLPFARGGGAEITSPRKGEVGAKRRVGIDFQRRHP